jgi:hypothetical protein
VLAQVHQSDQSTLVRWELAAAVTLAGDEQHRELLGERMGQVECCRTGDQQGC